MILDKLSKIFKYVVTIFILALTVTVTIHVFFRYVLHNTLFWGTEISVIFFMWIVFLGAAIAYHENMHICFDVFLSKMKPGLRKVVNLINYLFILFFMGYIVFFNFDVVTKNMGSYTEALKLPYGLVYSCMPISCFYIFIDTIAKMYKELKGGNDSK